MLGKIDQTWTLFLDRDGVINKRVPNEYITKWEDFRLEPKAIEAIVAASNIVKYVIVVTNQAGLQKQLMTEEALLDIHQKLMSAVAEKGGKIAEIYYCPHKAFTRCGCRKPAIGMGTQAKIDFPDLDFSKSIMVGDSISDIEFGKALGMKTVLVEGKLEEMALQRQVFVDAKVRNLHEFVANFIENQR
jgi:histidinol-phosphate phosphatase family protein